MKAKAVIFASVLLVGCQATNNTGSQQQSNTLSANATSSFAEINDQSFASLPENQNLWDIIRSELRMEIPNNSRVNKQRQFYLGKKKHLQNVLATSVPYIYWITGQIQQRHMPVELVLLPIVESAFNPYAKSPAKAAGIWQIIPSTGRNYGLKQTRAYDARLDVKASTTAALDILQRLNSMFNGDWLLTIAAYNSGEGRVLRAIKENQAQGKPTDYWSLRLPAETLDYVPRLLALTDIFKHSQRYGITLPEPDKNHALVSIPLNAPVDARQISQMIGLDVRKLKTFNAGIKGNIFGLVGPQYVMVPHKYAESLRLALNNGEFAPIPKAMLADNHAGSNRNAYTVRANDTLSGIAAQLGVSVKNLQHWNKLRGTTIRPGQTLLVKASAASGSTTGGTTTGSSKRLAHNSVIYKVRKGDSLYSIAKRHGVKIEDVKRWNIGTTTSLHPGDQLTLYLKNGKTAPDS